MRALRALRVVVPVLLLIVLAGGMVGLATLASPPVPANYEVIDQSLEPFREAFNAASDHVRAVLLVGPT